ncbi:MAG TPA: GNVR domain-containing protein [Candidatus Acidoferrales bacterium]|nr:GNVR domain-containing protein [Candidatus Acidoferrales bacterium]
MTKEAYNPEPAIFEHLTVENGPGQAEAIELAAHQQTIVVVRLLWTERRFLSRAAVAGLLAATLVAFLIPNRYASTAELMPPDSQSGSSLAIASALAGQAGSLGSLAGDFLGIQSTGALFIGVLRSRTVEERIVNRFDLKKVYGLRLDETACQKLAEQTSISEDRKSGIITLSVTDKDPKRAAAIASAYVDELDTLMTQLTTSSAHRERVFLEERLNAVKQELESAEKNFSLFASKNGTIDITEQGKAMVEAGATLEGQLIAAQSELEGLKQIYTANNVRVRATQARVTELHHQLEKLSGTAGPPPSDSASNATTLYTPLRQLPILGVPYADLFRELKVDEAVYETLTKEYEIAKVQEAKEIPTVKVLDPAQVPERKSYPPRLLLMILGTFLTTGLAMFWVLGEARWHATPSDHPGKQLAQEVFHTVRARAPWASSNGSSAGAALASLGRDSSKQDSQPRE